MGSPVGKLREMYEGEKARADEWQRLAESSNPALAELSEALAAARRSLENVRLLTAKAKARKEPLLRAEEIDHLLRFCAEAGVVGSVLRAAALAAPAASEEKSNGT